MAILVLAKDGPRDQNRQHVLTFFGLARPSKVAVHFGPRTISCCLKWSYLPVLVHLYFHKCIHLFMGRTKSSRLPDLVRPTENNWKKM